MAEKQETAQDGPNEIDHQLATKEHSTDEPQDASPQPASNPEKQTKPPPILCLGMARTGTASLAAALRILGVGKVHHGLEVYHKEFEPQWLVFSRAADATFPVLPTYTGKPFSRDEWDEVFGDYDAVTDVASFFGPSLIAAYPDARVILVERDIDNWYKSISEVFKMWEKPSTVRLTFLLGPIAKSHSGIASYKFSMGWTESTDPKDLHKNARAAYLRHYREIRSAVPPEQLLDFKLKDGWEPLCRFLGKEVPDVPFPHINEAAAYKKHVKVTQKDFFKRLAKQIFLPCL